MHMSGGVWDSRYIDAEFEGLLNQVFSAAWMRASKHYQADVYVELPFKFAGDGASWECGTCAWWAGCPRRRTSWNGWSRRSDPNPPFGTDLFWRAGLPEAVGVLIIMCICFVLKPEIFILGSFTSIMRSG